MTRRRRARRRGGAPWGTAGIVVASVIGVALIAWVLAGAGGPAGPSVAAPIPIASGPLAGATGVHIDAATVDFGHVPLDRRVEHAFRVSNDGQEVVQLGRATIEVLDGC